MSVPSLNSITKPRLLLGEGIEDRQFFEGFLGHLQRSDIQVCEFHGKANLQSFLKTLTRLPGFSNVISIGVTRDADYLPKAKSQQATAAHAAMDGIKSALVKAGLPCPKKHAITASDDFNGRMIRVSAFVFPDGRDAGMLEDLCLRSIATDPVNECLDAYFDCVSNRTGRRPALKDVAKARLHAWLATQSNPEWRLGEASLQRPSVWDFDNPEFSSLKSFLQNL